MGRGELFFKKKKGKKGRDGGGRLKVIRWYFLKPMHG